MLFREHRGGLDDSMKTIIVFHTRTELSRHLVHLFPHLMTSGAIIEARPYGGDDDRIGWKDVHILIANPGGPVGFIDGPLPSPSPGD